MKVKLHTVGHIIDGDKYKGWYVFVQTYQNTESYLVLICDSKTFGRDEAGNPIDDVEGYDTWMPDMPSLEYHFAKHNWNVEWLDWKPVWIKDIAE